MPADWIGLSLILAPTDKKVAQVAERVHRRVARLMEKRGLEPQGDPDEADDLWRDQPLLAELYGAPVSGRVATGPRAGMRITRVGDQVCWNWMFSLVRAVAGG